MPFIFRFGGADPNAFGGGFNPAGPQRPSPRPRKPRRAVGSAFTRTLINLVVTLVFGLVYFYLELPALNFHAEEFYVFVFLLCAVYCLCAVFTSGFQGDGGVKSYLTFAKKQCAIPFFTVVLLVIAMALGLLSSWVVLRAGAYSKLLPIESGDFTAEVEEISYDQIPMLDKDSAARLGMRKLGELADMVSQFEILPSYTQINYRGRPVRVTSLRYGDLIKWFTNRGEGLPAYLIIDMVSQEAEVVRLEEGMKYTIAEHFGRNLYRHLRFHYPTMMFDDPMFEINEEGTPYWVCPRIVRTIGLFGGVDVRGAVLVNAINGECEYHEQVPSWVDRLYSDDLIMQQYNFYGQYHNGFLNSIFGQRDVTVTTEGCNYLAIDDDVYVYTGVTSVTSDESNIGFILSNQRTKETRFYPIAGAEEYSAAASAESQVQQMRYEATFPLLLNIADQPTYFMALKGADGLVKMFAMVNVQQYDIVSTGSTVADCESNYRQTLAHRGLIGAGEQNPTAGNTRTQSGIVTEIRSSVIGGNTHYYVRMVGSLGYLDFDTAQTPRAVLLDVGDHIQYSYVLDSAEFPENGIIPATGFTFEGEEPPQENPAAS